MSAANNSEPLTARKSIDPEARLPHWRSFPTRDQLIFATHNSDHVKLDESVHLTIQHLREQLLALHRKGEAIQRADDGWQQSAFGLRRPTPEQQDALFDLHREFFDLTYSTVSALAAALNRLTKHVKGVPFNSNSKFINWLRKDQHFNSSPAPDILMAARDFRTIYVHPAQFKPINWMTAMGDGPTVVLLGTAPPWPDGATRTDASHWSFPAPSAKHVLWSLIKVCNTYFGSLPMSYEEDETRCKWEEQGFGSAPRIALENQVGNLLAQHYEREAGH